MIHSSSVLGNSVQQANYITGFVIHKISASLLSKMIPSSLYFAVCFALSMEAGESRGLLVLTADFSLYLLSIKPSHLSDVISS